MSFSVEELLRRAIENGAFDNLSNKGKKLDLSDYFEMPAEKRLGYTLLKNANFVPEEVEIMREIGTLKEKLPDNAGAHQKAMQKRLRELELRLALLMEKH